MARESRKYYTVVQDRWESAKRLRDMYDLLWETHVRKFAGQHWFGLNPESGKIELYRSPVKNYPLHRTNYVRRDTEIVKWILLSPLPRPIGRPAPGHGTYEEKRLLAEYLTGFMAQIWDHAGHEDVYEDVVLSLLCLGTAYQRPYWNADDDRATLELPADPVMEEHMMPVPWLSCMSCGQEMKVETPDPEQPCPACGAMPPMTRVSERSEKQMRPTPATNPDGTPQMIRQARGDVGIEFIPTHEWYWPRTARTFAQAGYAFRLRYQSPDWIQAMTGKTVEPDPTPPSLLYQWQMNTITGHPHELGVRGEGSQAVHDVAPFLEYLEQPNARHPKGLYLAFGSLNFAETEPLKRGDYPDTKLPFGLAIDRFRLVPNRLLGASLVEDLYPVNNQHNSEISQMDYMRTRFLSAKVITFAGSGVKKGQLESTADVIECTDPRLVPQSLNILTPIPQLLQTISVTRGRFTDMSGVEPPMAGQQPGSIRTTGGLLQLSLAAQQPLMGVKRRMLRTMRRLYEEVLRIAQQRYDDARELEIMGTGQEAEFRSFKAADLKKPGMMVMVDTDAVEPSSREAEREAFSTLIQYMPDVMQQLAMSDPTFLQSVLELYGFSKEKYNVEFNLHVRAAQVEMQEFLATGDPRGFVVDPDLDQHALHFGTNQKFLLSDQGRRLRLEQPAVYDAIKQHALQHKQLFEQAAAAQAATAPPQSQAASGKPAARSSRAA